METIRRAFAYIQGQKGKMGIAQTVDTTDWECETGLGGTAEMEVRMWFKWFEMLKTRCFG